MMRKAEWVRYPVLTDILQPQEGRCSKMEHCGHKDELTNHMNTAVNSYAPVRCLRMGAFCIALCENLFLLQLLICRFVHSLGEREKTLLCAYAARKEASEDERRQ